MKQRIETRCLFCRARVRADDRAQLAERCARHLRSCGAFATAFKKLQLDEGAELDRDTQIATLLHQAGLPVPASLPLPPAREAA